jgi:hypothetical protein
VAKPRKPVDRFGRRGALRPPATSDEAHARATEDIAARLAQIASSRQIPNSFSRGTLHEVADSLAIELRGAQVVDSKLVSPRSDFTGVEVISINAYPDRDQPESVVIRIDGWDGHLSVVLPRDRAALLIKKLEHAIDASRARTSRHAAKAPVAPAKPEVVVDSSPPGGEAARHGRRRIKRGQVLKRHRTAIDDALDSFGDDQGTDDCKDG